MRILFTYPLQLLRLAFILALLVNPICVSTLHANDTSLIFSKSSTIQKRQLNFNIPNLIKNQTARQSSYCYIFGPTVVNSGTPYYYSLSCGWGQPSYIYNWYVFNGDLQDYGDGSVQITWNSGATEGYIYLYEGYNFVASLTVSINSTDPIQPGTITTPNGNFCYG